MQHHNSPAASREIDRPRDPARVAEPHFPQLVAKRADMRHSYFLRPVSTQLLADPQAIGLMPGRKAANFAADRTRRYDSRPLDHINDVISTLDCQSVATFRVSRLMLRGSPQRHYLAGRRCCAEVPQARVKADNGAGMLICVG
jgi:hypothetical protein